MSSSVDILNTPYGELPEHWQAENKAAAIVVVDIFEQVGNINLDDPEQYQLVGDIVHNEWVKRNDWDEKAKVPFAELSQEEKDKDISQVRTAIELGLDK